MIRIVDRFLSDQRPVGNLARSLGLVAWLATGTLAEDGDGPTLTPPGDTPVLISQPATALPTIPPSVKPSLNALPRRATLALPGLTTPITRPSISLDGPKSGGDAITPELSLDAPIEMRPSSMSTTPKPGATTSRSSQPLELDSPSLDDPVPLDAPATQPKPSTRRSTPSAQPVPTSARRPRFFGLLPGTPVAAPAASRTSIPGRSVVEDDLRDDPAAESALKRRIERQAREAVGNRARSVEVKVTGKNAVVHAAGVKFLQKRAVRKQLEALPALSGLRSTIEVED